MYELARKSHGQAASSTLKLVPPGEIHSKHDGTIFSSLPISLSSGGNCRNPVRIKPGPPDAQSAPLSVISIALYVHRCFAVMIHEVLVFGVSQALCPSFPGRQLRFSTVRLEPGYDSGMHVEPRNRTGVKSTPCRPSHFLRRFFLIAYRQRLL